MKAKKSLSAAALAGLLVSFYLIMGCQSAGGGFALFASPSPSPVPTPTPKPTPVPVVVLAGATDAQAYAAAVERAVLDAGLIFVSAEDSYAAAGETAKKSVEPPDATTDTLQDSSSTSSRDDSYLSDDGSHVSGFAQDHQNDESTSEKSIPDDMERGKIDPIDAVNAFRADGAASVILYCPDGLPELDRLTSRYPLFLCAATRQTIPQGVSNLCYDDEMAPAEALQLAFDFPPHLAPVRMLGLFASEESDAFGIWQKAVSDGLILERGVFHAVSDAASETDLAPAVNEWMTSRMKKLYPGMLDCIYAETGTLAVHAANSLLALNRADVELFAAGTDGGICALMEQHPTLIANVVGMDVMEAASISAQSAITQLTSSATIERSLTPQVYPAATAEP